jgi:uncharacterized lipoprotein YmbA
MKTTCMLAVLCAACLGGKRPNYQYYVLTPERAPHSQLPSGNARALAIDQVTIPGYLDREQIATRTVGHQLVYSSTDRWAEPLDQGIERTLREDLAAKLAPSGIEVQVRSGATAYEVRVDVLRAERNSQGEVELWARWTLRSQAEVIDSGETHLQVPTTGADTNAMATALSEAIARMASELATRVKKADVVAEAR